MQLAMLYAGVFAVFAGGVLAATNLLLVRQTQHGAEVHQLTVGSAIAFGFAVLLSLALGWLIAGRFLGRLRTIMATARCGFRAISYTRSDRIRTAIPTFSYTPVRRTPLPLA